MTDQNAPQPADQQPEISAQPQPERGRQPGPVPYQRFKQVLDQTKELRQQITDLTAKANRADDLRAELTGLQLQMHAREVAADLGLPADMVPYIQGDSKRAIGDKAEGLLAAMPHLRQPEAPAPFTPGQVSDAGWYARNRWRVLRRFGFDG